MHGSSPFIDTAAVEAWDAWFRWREPHRLHDVSIEATWNRVLTALGSGRAASMPLHPAETIDAFASWRLLLDERILATAGTPAACWPSTGLVAAINAAMFVRRHRSGGPRIEFGAIAATARLAVRALACAASLRPGDRDVVPSLRVGLIGVADALALLGLRYDSADARKTVGDICHTLAEACLEESVRQARTHGPLPDWAGHALQRAARDRGLSNELVADARRCGVRHARLTAVTSQRCLALLANNVADALDPLSAHTHVSVIAAVGGARSVRSSGYARICLAGTAAQAATPPDTIDEVSLQAQVALRAAAQLYVDEPIGYPFAVARAPNAAKWRSIQRVAQDSGLARPGWRVGGEVLGPTSGTLDLRNQRSPQLIRTA